MQRHYQSWGQYFRGIQQGIPFLSRHQSLPIQSEQSLTYLPFGNGRSYGDSCLNNTGKLIDCISLNQIIAFDEDNGLLTCEAGLLLGDIIRHCISRGWFIAVTPGTQFVTLGGAIANDVHGKNHYHAGTFGCHVKAFELLRTDGTRLLCSGTQNTELFRATIGGLGLTGVITWAQIQLKPVSSAFITQEVVKFSNLDEFFVIDQDSASHFEYSVAWIDCLAKGKNVGRGLYIRANHAQDLPIPKTVRSNRQLVFPCELRFSLINRFSLKCFNALYYAKQRKKVTRSTVYYESFFYPLDTVRYWNRMYGKKGFFQYQCVVPKANAQRNIRQILELIAATHTGSFLVVLKSFGNIKSPGLLSFPQEGYTLALDFPNQGEPTLALLERLDKITIMAKGAVYPAKDARMSAANFQKYFPQWRELQSYIDPRLSSGFWRRVTQSTNHKT